MTKNLSAIESVMNILKEVVKLPHRNKNIFFFIFLSTLITSILLIRAFIYSLTTAMTNISMDVIPLLSMSPAIPEYLEQILKIKVDAMFVVLIELVFLLLMSAVTLFSMMTTIYVSSMSYVGRDLKIKDLLIKIKKIWIRPVLTFFYITLINTGFLVLFLVPIVFLVLLSKSYFLVILTIGIILALLAIFLNMYLSLVFMLSIVTSVLEEDCYGLQAIGKGTELLKERKVVGLVLTFMVVIIALLNPLVYIMNMNIQSKTVELLILFCGIIFAVMVKILSIMMYTVFYFDCKQIHGEDVSVENMYNIGYTKVSTVALVDSALP